MAFKDKIKDFYNNNKLKVIIGISIFYLIGAIIAGYLSYKCNIGIVSSKNSINMYAFISAIFSWFYLIFYMIFKKGLCMTSSYSSNYGSSYDY